MVYSYYTHYVSKRLQVVLEDAELEEIQQAADREELTVSEWVRKALREARGRGPARSQDAKLAAIKLASSHAFPTGDIGQMLDEIDRGYVTGGGP